MIVGIIKETKNGEGRVGLVPNYVNTLFGAGHKILVQSGAGASAGFNDVDYFLSGADIINSAEEVVTKCDILVKVKEPTPEEYPLLDLLKGKILYTFLHLGANPSLAKKLCENKITGISYDTVEDESGNLYMLHPMSDIAGMIAADIVNDYGKSGVSRKPKKVSIVGAGTVGQAALYRLFVYNPLKISEIHVFDLSKDKIELLKRKYLPGEKSMIFLHNSSISPEHIETSDAIVGAVLVPGAKAPCVVSKEHWKKMKDKSLLIDVAIDQGGCIEGVKATSHSNPHYTEHDKIFYCTPNMPGARPHEASVALSEVTSIPLLSICKRGIDETCRILPGFIKGINTKNGEIVNETVKNALTKM